MPISTIINIAATVFALLEVCRYLLLCHRQKVQPKLERIVSNALAASSVPMGLTLIFAGIYPSIMNQLEGLNLYYAVAGISLLFVTWKTLIHKESA